MLSVNCITFGLQRSTEENIPLWMLSLLHQNSRNFCLCRDFNGQTINMPFLSYISHSFSFTTSSLCKPKSPNSLKALWSYAMWEIWMFKQQITIIWEWASKQENILTSDLDVAIYVKKSFDTGNRKKTFSKHKIYI